MYLTTVKLKSSMPNWKKVVVSGSAANLSSLHVDTSVTASIFSGSFTGDLFGTASYSTYALTASYALNAAGGGGGGATTGSNTFEGDQIISGSLTVTGSITGNVLLTPQTASNITVSTGLNGLLISPVQMWGSSSVAVGSNLIIL